jgi:phosphotransferase system, enzyme I, PtsP
MFPLVTVLDELDSARALVERELAWARKGGALGPSKLEVGAMLEAPAFAFAIPHLKGRADFISIGTNDLMQYFFAADRGNPRVGERYDLLSAPALTFLSQIRQAAASAGLPLSICGEAAGRPLEAMALIALGFDRLSMPASGIGPVKQMIRSLNARHAGEALGDLIKGPKSSIRSELLGFAGAQGVML